MSEDRVTLAAIMGAHGVRGEVRLKLFSEDLARYERVEVGGRELTLVSAKDNGVARFAEIADRTAAEALRGQLVTVMRSALPPLDDGEFYHADLIGLTCESSDGAPIGKVAVVENFGAGDILEIEKPDGRRAMAPFREGVAELKDGRIVIDPTFLA